MKHLVLVLTVSLFSLATANASPIIFIVRHAEKAPSGGKDPDLSAAGQKRADALARILRDADIKAIFTTELKRTQETAAPTAKESQIRPAVIPANDIPALAAKLRALNGNALVIGHGNTIPDVMKALGIAAPINIPDEDYTEIFVVVLGDKPELARLHYPF